MSLNPARTQYTAWSPYPPCYIRGVGNTASLPVYLAAEVVAPTAGTYTLYDPAGNEITSGSVVVGADNVPTYTLTSGHLGATAELSATYLEVWELTLTGGSSFTFERCVAVARRDLKPVVADRDLTRMYAGIERDLPPGMASFQPWIEEAWNELVTDLIAWGIHPQRIVSPESLRRWHREQTLAQFFTSCAARQQGRGNYLELAKTHTAAADAAKAAAKVRFDADDDGKPDDSGQLDAVEQSVVHRNAAPRGYTVGSFGWW